MSKGGARGIAALVGQRVEGTKVADQTMDAVLRAPAGTTPRSVSLDAVQRSPYQPASRPSSTAIAAVRAAIAEAGSLAALVRNPDAAGTDPADGAVFAKLAGEARDLALLAADVAVNGIEVPLEVRTVAGGCELLSGHRRLAAAQLAGLPTVRVVELPAVSDDRAAEIVFRRNRLRADFTAWEEARSLAELQARRNAARAARGEPAEPLLELAAAMGYSVGRVSELLRIARTFLPLLPELGAATPAAAEEALSALPYRWLRDTSAGTGATSAASKQRRGELLAATRLKTRLSAAADGVRSDAKRAGGHPGTPGGHSASYTLEPAASETGQSRRRLGAPLLVLTVRKSAEDFTPAEATALLEQLDRRLLKALRARAKQRR